MPGLELGSASLLEGTILSPLDKNSNAWVWGGLPKCSAKDTYILNVTNLHRFF